MADTISNLTQVIYNSPQVTSLVGGRQAAEEEALRQGRIATDRRYEDELARTVMAGEKSGALNPYGDDDEGPRETRRQRLARLKAEREVRLAAARAAREERKRRARDNKKQPCETDDQRKTVVDVCV